MNATLVRHIEMTPGVVGGKPRIAGTRIRANGDSEFIRGLAPSLVAV